MSTTTDADEESVLRGKIERLEGRIARHKYQAGIAPQDQQPYQGPYRSGYSSPRRSPHQPPPPNVKLSSLTLSHPEEGSSSWVARAGRNLQLINSSVYKKNTDSEIMPTAHNQRKHVKDGRAKSRLMNYMQRNGAQASGPNNAQGSSEVTVDGVRFRVSQDGNTLMRLPGQPVFPKYKVMVGSALFSRAPDGNLTRDAFLKTQRQRSYAPVQKISELCKIFTSTGTCHLGPSCRYIHDATKVAICKDFLMRGECRAGESCDLSHDLTAERTPSCLHFAKGNCAKSKTCRFAHIELPAGAPNCRDFGIYGYCEKGSNCRERHLIECPDFANTGTCNTTNCKLLHRERASVLRRATASGGPMETTRNSDDDISETADNCNCSDDELMEPTDSGHDFVVQKDFIRF